MKKFLIGLAVLLVLLIVVALAVPFLIPADTYKQQLVKAVGDQTGRELTIAGPVRLSLLPRLEVDVRDVAFANAPGAREPQMATLGEMQVRLRVLPLLRGEVRVDSFVLREPVIHLEVNEAGEPNWVFGGGAAGGAPAGGPEGVPEGGGAPSGRRLQNLSLGDVRLTDARATYHDARTGTDYDVSDVNMRLSLPDLDSPFTADGSLMWNDQKIKLAARTDQPRQLLDGAPAPVKVEVDSKPVSLAYDGTASFPPALSADGAVKLNVPSVRDLAAWVGSPIEMEGQGLGPLAIDGTVSVAGDTYAFRKATLSLDDMTARGDFELRLKELPLLTAKLEVDELDLNPYLPPPSEEPAEAKPAAPEGEAAAPSDWSDAPIDLSALRRFGADLGLTVGGIRARDVKVGRSTLKVTVDGGVMTADLSELNLYDGHGTGRVLVDARGTVPSIQEKFAIEGVQAEPLLTDAAGFKRLEGTGRLELAATTRGGTQREMVQALNGTGSMKFLDGAIKGINIGGMVRNVRSAFLDPKAREAQKTDFAELSGTFVIENGIVRNDDLVLLNPLLRVGGKGTVDLPQRTVNYRITPKAVATLEGQGGQSDVTGLAVPVLVKGPWDNLSYAPDLAGATLEAGKTVGKAVQESGATVEGLLTEPKQTTKDMKDALEHGGRQTIESLKGMVGVDRQPPEQPEAAPQEEAAPDATQAEESAQPEAEAEQPQEQEQAPPAKDEEESAEDLIRGLFK